MRPSAGTETLQPGQETDQTISKDSARDEPRRQLPFGKPRPQDRAASTLGQAAPRKQDGGLCFPLLPREPPPGPQKRDKDVAAPTLRSGNLRGARGHSRAPGRRLHLAGRGESGMGLSKGQRSPPSARTGWTPASPRPPGHCSPPPAPTPPSPLANRKLLPSRPRPASQRPGSDLRRLLQSGQEEGGSLESGAPLVLLLLLPPRLRRRPSDSSFCLSRRGTSQTTRAELSPAEASSAAASGARGAADRLAVQDPCCLFLSGSHCLTGMQFILERFWDALL
ncbi:ras-related protein Ral-A isoform X1 [Herpailurus yagouaroundi]|uniref:ras-related protein Ral-A isoform X1 n=1 Tax=Herpailurus yagouaroundi TaxID=1608482 RepID=UPI001AD78C24|nr:ras-related protein Ral-A isoform X1 [Puma yagouaroundi]